MTCPRAPQQALLKENVAREQFKRHMPIYFLFFYLLFIIPI